MIRLFRVFIPVGVLTVLLTEILLDYRCLRGGIVLRSGSRSDELLLYDNGSISIGIVLFSITIGMYLQDLYSDIYVKSKITLMQQLCLVIGAVFLIRGFISYLNASLRMPLHIMVSGSVLAVLSIFYVASAFRSFMSRWLAATACCWSATAPSWTTSPAILDGIRKRAST